MTMKKRIMVLKLAMKTMRKTKILYDANVAVTVY